MPAPLVSVIVPAYGHADYLEGCLGSIQAQSHEALELVLVDDCSPDGTWDCAQDLLAGPLAQRFRNVVLLRNETNLGAHATINRAIAAAGGSHLALINSDDLWHPARITALLSAMDATGADLSFSLVEVFADAQSGPRIDEFFRLFALRQSLALAHEPSTGLALMRANVAISTGNLLFTRRLYDQVGPFLPLKYCHDWDFLLQALFFTEPVVVHEPHYRYRLHASNSFAALGHVAMQELELATRRFLRRGLRGGLSPNPLFPSAANWPGLFDAMLQDCGYQGHIQREKSGLP